MSIHEFSNMIGKTFAAVTGKKGVDEMRFLTSDGTGFRFYHSQDCCESVLIEDVVGDLTDLIGSPLLVAEQISSEGAPAREDVDSYTWTFYRFSTVKGTVVVRWLGESNGYYSESVEFDACVT